MTFLSDKPGNECFILESSNNNDVVLLPRFYLKKWSEFIQVTQDFTPEMLSQKLAAERKDCQFRYIIFCQKENLESRVAAFEKTFGPLAFMSEIESSYLDRFMHWLNPYGNKSQDFYIYERR
jgi:hypothetical protein